MAGRPAYSTSVIVDAGNNEVSNDSLYGMLTVGTSVSEIKIGATALSGRKSVSLQADEDNGGIIYVGFGTEDPTSTKAMFKMSAGGAIVIPIDKFNVVPIKVIASADNQKIYVCEFK